MDDNEPLPAFSISPTKTAAPSKRIRTSATTAITGVMPPQLGEVIIREWRPTVLDGFPALAVLGQKLTRTVVLAPLAWLLLAPLFLCKFLPFLCKRYTLTNRALKIQRGLRPYPSQTLPLEHIDAVQVDGASYNTFYRSASVEILTGQVVVMRLTGVPAPESFRHAVMNATMAWVPGKAGQFTAWSAAPVRH